MVLVLDPGPAQPRHAAPEAFARQRRPLGQTRADGRVDVGRPVRSLAWRLCPEHARGFLVWGKYFKTPDVEIISLMSSTKKTVGPMYLAASSPVTHCFDKKQKCSGMLRESALGEAGGARPVSKEVISSGLECDKMIR